MAYQSITSVRSTRFPFMGLGCGCTGLGCNCASPGLGAVTSIPSYDTTAQYYKDLVARVQRELYAVHYNETAYRNALARIYGTVSPIVSSSMAQALASVTISLTIEETKQIVLQLLARVGASLVAAKTLETAYVENYPGARVAVDRALNVARSGLAAITMFVQYISRARMGTSGLGDAELLPALGVGALVAMVLVGLPGINVLVGGAVAYAVYTALQSTEQAISNAIRLAREWCQARQQSTGRPCTVEEFAAQVEANKRQIIDESNRNPLNTLIDRLINAGTSALKTVLIIGGVVVIGYVGVSLLFRKAARALVPNRKRRHR